MFGWIKANTNAPGDNLPLTNVAVDAKDDQGNQFVAWIVNPGNTWAYIEPAEKFGVAACVEYWRYRNSSSWARFTTWLVNNHGVLITPDAAGIWTCQNCGKQHLFANEIGHAAECLFELAKSGE